MPKAAPTIANPTPVLPEVDSTIVPPTATLPESNKSWTMYFTGRSFTEPDGLFFSNLT